MAFLHAPISPFFHNHPQTTGFTPLLSKHGNLKLFRSKLPFRASCLHISGNPNGPRGELAQNPSIRTTFNFMGVMAANAAISPRVFALPEAVQRLSVSENSRSLLVLADLDPLKSKLAIGIIGPLLSAFGFLFIVRIVMSWYPKLPVGKFPFVIAYAPTEPLLSPTRKLIPPVGGVDVTPVVWFGLVSFLSEILVGPQGLLVLLSQQI